MTNFKCMESVKLNLMEIQINSILTFFNALWRIFLNELLNFSISKRSMSSPVKVKRKIKKNQGSYTVFNTFAKTLSKNNNDQITQTLPVSVTQHHKIYFSLFYTWVIITSFEKKRLKSNMLLFLFKLPKYQIQVFGLKWETLPGPLLIWKTSQIFWCRWNWVSEGGRKSLLPHVRELSSNRLISTYF